MGKQMKGRYSYRYRALRRQVEDEEGKGRQGRGCAAVWKGV